MEFWGVEVPAGKTVTVKPEQGERIHLSQVTFSGEKGEEVLVFLKIGEKKHLGGTLIQGRIPQLITDLVFHRDFELSHDRAKGSVNFLGFKSPDIKLDEALISDEENEVPVSPGAAASNVVKADQKQKAKVADLKPGSHDSDALSDEEKESSDDEYDSEEGMAVDGEYSDDSEEDSGEEEETPKQPEPRHKKRASESASKAPASKKAKTAAAVTPQKTEEKKKEGHTAKEGGKSPANAKQSPKAGGQSSGGGGNKKPSNSKKKNSGSNSKGKGKGRA